jgi:hypothetical protein
MRLRKKSAPWQIKIFADPPGQKAAISQIMDNPFYAILPLKRWFYLKTTIPPIVAGVVHLKRFNASTLSRNTHLPFM